MREGADGRCGYKINRPERRLCAGGDGVRLRSSTVREGLPWLTALTIDPHVCGKSYKSPCATHLWASRPLVRI